MLNRAFIVGYFFHIAMAYRGCTFGIDTKAFNLDITENSDIKIQSLARKQHVAH